VNYFIPGCIVESLFGGNNVYAGTYCPGPHAGQGYGFHWFVDDTWVDFMPGNGMEGTYIRAIAAEGDTKVWFSAGYTDVCRHYVNLLDHKGTADKADDEWTVYDFTVWGICSVYAIAIDPDGNRWFGTGQDIRVLTNDNNWIIYNEVNFGGDFAFDGYGNVWVGQTDSVFKHDGSSWVEYNSREEAIEANFDVLMTTLNGNWDSEYYGLWVVEEPAGLWIKKRDPLGGSSRGVSFYDGQDWITYTPDNSGLYSKDVSGIAVDFEGSVWIATDRDINNRGGISKFVPNPDFSLSAAPSTIFLQQGQNTIINVTVRHLRGLVPTTTLSLTGLPPGISASFESNPVTPTAQVQLTITSDQTALLGMYNLNLNATTVDGLSQTLNLTLYVVEEAFYTYLPAAFHNIVTT
jgi:hypothetical protein